jgi:hypothetical protein
MIEDRDVRGAVVAHDGCRISVLHPAAFHRCGVAGYEAVHFAAADLQVN